MILHISVTRCNIRTDNLSMWDVNFIHWTCIDIWISGKFSKRKSLCHLINFFLTNFTVCFFGTTIQRLHYWLVFVEYKLSIKYSTIGTFTPKPQDKKEQISTIQLTTRLRLFMKISSVVVFDECPMNIFYALRKQRSLFEYYVNIFWNYHQHSRKLERIKPCMKKCIWSKP